MSESGVIDKTALVFGQMNEPPGARMRVAETGLTMAEYFRDVNHQDVLLFIDNIFRFTQAGSEVSALLGRMPLVSVMTEPDGTRHENQSVHRGTLRAAAEGPEIVYEQVDEGVRARISLTRTADGVQMRRMGEMTGALHFQPGRKTPGLYGTAYGDIPVAVYTREVLVEESEKGGEMRLDYDMFVGGERTAATVMTLTWRL